MHVKTRPLAESILLPAAPQLGGYNFGIRNVLLIISVPDSANSSTSGCSVQPARCQTPPYTVSPIRPCQAANANTAVSSRLVAIGVPSKYATL